MMEEKYTDLVSTEFPRQLDIAKISVYGLSILSAALFPYLHLH
jgi:hypothetical protein